MAKHMVTDKKDILKQESFDQSMNSKKFNFEGLAAA